MSTNRDGYLGLILSKGILNGRYSSLTPLNVYGGYFSILLKAYDNQKNKEVAIKFYDPAKRNEDYRLKCFHREADLLKQLTGQKNIVEMIDGLSQIEVTLKDVVSGIELKDAYEYVVLELAKGDVGGYIYNNSSEDIKTAIKKLVYFREMCKAVARIHRSKICHRDLKPSNFLIFDKSEIKLSDLGTATVLDGRAPLLPYYSDPVGDMGYWSPEQFCNIGISDINAFKADIFSLGTILFEMFTKTKMTRKVYDSQLITKLFHLKTHLAAVNPSQHIGMFDSIIDSIVTPYRLPDMYSFNNSVPLCIKDNLNNLYKSLAELNYKKRESDFDSILRRLDICMLRARNERAENIRFKRRKIAREKKC